MWCTVGYTVQSVQVICATFIYVNVNVNDMLFFMFYDTVIS